ncbi:ImmA/IrrE family metallo-endopeptidase [Desulfuribacillus alkaliarsenatis]|uniref:IrrE N-terminal-like domain-containing protein n=1 Tax=Desulfuribacillus alkaliarsenatis TaxID=766136 RepID=A0A1E5G0Y3_9FIRM|nr:ImmA/IrrE family metallo-endopeptidase [Desulfuribacillus alkaliarsenatis]OEF96108.1 hypothetical protein BHF68_10265 [Desulfuribacillus alkaliarsenatis]
MEAQAIIDLALKLRNKYRTNNPFEIASTLGIRINYIVSDNQTKGYVVNATQSPLILINKKYNYTSQKVVCAHELGHALMHTESSINHFQRDRNSSNSENIRDEYEANLFAVALLFNHDELNMKLLNMSNYMLKSILDYNITNI